MGPVPSPAERPSCSSVTSTMKPASTSLRRRTRRTPGSTTWGRRSSLGSSRTRAAATASTATPRCAASRATATTTPRSTTADGSSPSTTAATCGARRTGPTRRTSTSSRRATAWATRASRASAAACAPRCCCSCRSTSTRRSTRSRVTNTSDAAKKSSTLFSLRRVQPVERRGRPDQLPAQPVASARSRSRTARSTTRPNTASVATTTRCTASMRRSRASTPTATPSSATATASTRPPCRTRASRRNSIASGWYPCGRTRSRWSSAPGETKTYTFVLGYLENAEDDKWEAPGVINKTGAKELLARFATTEETDAEFAKLNAYWDNLLGSYTVQSGDDKLNRMVNIWNQYQCMVTYNMSRSASYFETGIGPRHGLPRLEPGPAGLRAPGARARPRAHHRHRVDAVRGRQRLPPVPAAHQARKPRARLRLQRRPAVAHPRRGRLHQGDRRLRDPRRDGALRQRRVARAAAHGAPQALVQPPAREAGPHGLPLIGRADWNDCLNLNCFSSTPGESFQTTENQAGGVAESRHDRGHVRRDRPRVRGARAQARGRCRGRPRRQGHRRHEARPCVDHGWDGEWFLRAYDFYGNKVGTDETRRGQDLDRAAGLLRHGRHRRRRRQGHQGARLRPGAPQHPARHGAAEPRVHDLPDPAWRGLDLPAGLQGERRHLLPQQPVGHHRGDRGGPRRVRVASTTSRSPPRIARRSPRCTASSRTSTRR